MAKVLAVGDVHTKTWIVEAIESIHASYDYVVFIGDYVDDWGVSPVKNVITLYSLMSFMQRHPSKVRAVIGNHDFVYLHQELAGRSSGWGYATQILIDAPENKAVKGWLASLPISLDIDGVTYSHAGFTESWDGELTVDSLWNNDSPIWNRPRKYGGTAIYKNFPQVIGHTPVATCEEVDQGVWCIDTFSTYRDGTPIGDHTVLEVTDGTMFNTKKIQKTNANSNDTPHI